MKMMNQSPGRLRLHTSTETILLVQENSRLLHESPLILRVSIRWVTGFTLGHCEGWRLVRIFFFPEIHEFTGPVPGRLAQDSEYLRSYSP
jgi:hypothetical protein